MTYQNEFTLSEALLGQLTADGLEALPTLFQVLLNAAVQIERLKHLGFALHERTEQRTGHAVGYKGETLPSRRVPVFSLSAAEAPPIARSCSASCLRSESSV